MKNRKTFTDSVADLPEGQAHTETGLKVQAARPQDRTEKMTLHFSLAIPQEAQDQLEAAVASGEVVPVDDLNTKYAAPAASVESLVSWLKAAGYEITRVTPDRTGVFARATVAQIEQSLDVNMVRVTKDGITYTAAQNAPSLPADIGENVHAIGGLQPFRRAHRHSRRFPQCNRKDLALAGNNRTAAIPSPSIANAPPYLVPEVLKAYHADGVPVTGRGQTIAILIDTFPSDADLQEFWQRNNLPVTSAQIQKINVGGGQLPAAEGEETLDTEWASGVAPGANVRIYASGSLQFVDLDRALDQILADLPAIPGLRQLSISLGLGETYMPKGEVRTQHQTFLRLAAAGVNVFVSSGDAGSNPDSTGHNSNGPLQAEYFSSDPCVVGVGGTSLVLASDGSVAEETGWADGGGGQSILFQRPSWQTGAGVPPGTARLVPDVSLAADPNTGAFLVLNGQVQQIGGTSWGAPVWAAFCALINEARATAQLPALPFLNPLLYPLLGSRCLRDITVGNNGAFAAGPDYDLVTGLGVPDVAALIQTLTSEPASLAGRATGRALAPGAALPAARGTGKG